MRLNNLELMEEFYSEIKEDYPDLDFETLKEVCFGPWRFVKDEMESGNLNGVRLKYFGVFQVYPGRARNMLHNNRKNFEKGILDKKKFEKLESMLTNYIKKLEDNEKN